MRRIIWLAICIPLFSCNEDKTVSIEQLQIVTKEPDSLATWYRENLGFEIVERVLLYEDFKIRLKKNEEAASPQEIEDFFKVKHLPGFFKFGFITNQFDQLVDKLRENKATFVGSVMENEILNRRVVIVRDPDGNLIQLFEDFGRYRLKPYYFAIMVESIGEQENGTK